MSGQAFTHIRERRVFLPLKIGGAKLRFLHRLSVAPYDTNNARSLSPGKLASNLEGVGESGHLYIVEALTRCGGSLRTPCHRSTVGRACFLRPRFSLPSFVVEVYPASTLYSAHLAPACGRGWRDGAYVLAGAIFCDPSQSARATQGVSRTCLFPVSPWRRAPYPVRGCGPSLTSLLMGTIKEPRVDTLFAPFSVLSMSLCTTS